MRSVLTKKELKNLRLVCTTKKQARQIIRRNKQLIAFLDLIPTSVRAMNKHLSCVYNDEPVVVKVSNKTYIDIDAYETDYISGFGCPHCKCDDCDECAWTKFPHPKSEWAEYCLCATFGGIPYSIVEGSHCNSNYYVQLVYQHDGEDILFKHPSYPVDKCDMVIIRKEIERIRRFLDGHIEWANAVLEGITA